MTTLIISNDEIDGIMEIVNSLTDSGLLIKSVTQTIESETKEQRERERDFLVRYQVYQGQFYGRTKKSDNQSVIRTSDGVM